MEEGVAVGVGDDAAACLVKGRAALDRVKNGVHERVAHHRSGVDLEGDAGGAADVELER